MEATIATPVPPQSALSTQASPKQNTSAQLPPRKNIPVADGTTNRALTAAPFIPKNITVTNEYLSRSLTATPLIPKKATEESLHKSVSTSQQSPINVVAAQGSWQIPQPVAPSPQKTLPAVKDFLQKAYETVQLSQQNTKVAAQESLQKHIVASPMSPQTTLPAFHHPLQPAVVTVSPVLIKSVATIEKPLQRPEAGKPLPTPIKTISTHVKPFTLTRTVQLNSYVRQGVQTSSTSQIGITSNTVETRSTSKVSQTGFSYNTAWPVKAKPRQEQVPPQKRATLVAKRRQSPNVHKTAESSEAGTSEEAQKTDSSSESEKASKTQSPQSPKAQSSSESDESPSSTQPSRTSKETPKERQAPNSPSIHGTSRVAQTFQEFKAQMDRGANTSQKSTQSPKKNYPQNAQSKANARHKDDEPDPKKRVLVSGFPPYTQSQDLMRVLSPFGTCRIDKCRNRLAVVTFETELAAQKAIRASEDLSIYGDFIEIQPYTNHRHVEDMFRAYKKVISTQKGQDIIQPNKIDLSGDFFQQLENIQNAIRLTQDQAQGINNLYIDLERVLQREWPGCVAIPFGSIPTGLGIKSSDADCYVELPAALRTRGGAGAFVTRARRLLAQYPGVFAQLVAIPRANTPIVKFRHVPSGFHCDVNSKTPLGAQNSKLVKLLLQRDPRLAPAAVLVKYWAKVHELSGTGRLTNYALTMMVVFYLQRPPAALLPPVERLQREPSCRFIVDHWDAGFEPRRLPGAPSALSLPELLGGFFEFYAAFDFDELAVCPFLGAPVRKALFDEPARLPAEFARYVANVRANLASPIRHATPFCVQDPFEQSHNVASSVSAKLAADIRAHFKFAADAFAADRATGCRGFLRTILLSRPRLVRDRATPTTRVCLLPRVRGDFLQPAWRDCVRRIVVDEIFGRILAIELKREPEREAAEKKKAAEREGENEAEGARAGERGRGRRAQEDVDKEVYSGGAQQPVWRRRRNYAVDAPEAAERLVARQRAHTEAIVAAGGRQHALRFHLELGYRDEPRYFALFAKLVDGDLCAFRGFVAFLHTALADWFKMMVRPHLAPLSAEAARANVEDANAYRCTVEFERTPAPTPAPAPPADPAAVCRALGGVSLADTDTESTDS